MNGMRYFTYSWHRNRYFHLPKVKTSNKANRFWSSAFFLGFHAVETPIQRPELSFELIDLKLFERVRGVIGMQIFINNKSPFPPDEWNMAALKIAHKKAQFSSGSILRLIQF